MCVWCVGDRTPAEGRDAASLSREATESMTSVLLSLLDALAVVVLISVMEHV